LGICTKKGEWIGEKLTASWDKIYLENSKPTETRNTKKE